MKVGSVTVHEMGLSDPIYISPEINGKDFENVWAMWIWNDGSADIYLKRKTTGAVLGKPIHLEGPKHEHTFAEDVSKEFRPCLGCGREYRTVHAGKKHKCQARLYLKGGVGFTGDVGELKKELFVECGLPASIEVDLNETTHIKKDLKSIWLCDGHDQLSKSK